MAFPCAALALAAALVALGAGPSAWAASGFGARKTPAAAPAQAENPKNPPKEPLKEAKPPNLEGTEWIRVPFEKAESELLALFSRDLGQVEKLAQVVAIFEARANGALPSGYRRTLRTRIERAILASPRLRVRECPACEEARLTRTESGELKYESAASDPARAARIASQIGVDHLFYAELNYSPEDLQLRVKLAKAQDGEILWSKEYSTADVVKTRESIERDGRSDLSEGDSLARVIIGEIAFTTVISPTISFLPSIDRGSGGSNMLMPGLDLFIGERFDRMRKVFGFVLGASASVGDAPENGQPLPFAIRVGPQFRYGFNPYSTTQPRWSIISEVGALVSTGIMTGYAGLGAEMALINRFSVTLMPSYIFPVNARGPDDYIQKDDGTFDERPGQVIGTLGGLGLALRMNINW